MMPQSKEEMLKGQAKTDYQREYMRSYMRVKRGSKQGLNTGSKQSDVKTPEETKQAKLKALRKLMLGPNGPGWVGNKEDAPFAIPEGTYDAGGEVIPDYW